MILLKLTLVNLSLDGQRPIIIMDRSNNLSKPRKFYGLQHQGKYKYVLLIGKKNSDKWFLILSMKI